MVSDREDDIAAPRALLMIVNERRGAQSLPRYCYSRTLAERGLQGQDVGAFYLSSTAQATPDHSLPDIAVQLEDNIRPVNDTTIQVR